MGKFKLLLIAMTAAMLTLGLAGLASAASITCGACHSSPPVNGDNCTNNARNLHGTHVNYSSAFYPEVVANNGKCAYCHSPVADVKGIASATHNNNYKNVTGNGGSGKAVGLDYVVASKTCTNSCHKNNNTGKWGNYTATVVGNVKLDCGSCHDNNVTGNFAAQATSHNRHILSNCTTPAGLMNAAGDAGCAACHPDARNDLWSAGKADDGTKKAYPHALDGTRVISDNATLSNAITAATKNGPNTTCTNNCHSRTSVAWNVSYTAGGTASCNLCHYWEASPLDTNNTGTAAQGVLSAGHNPHIKAPYRMACTTCHPSRTDRDNHATKLPFPLASNANVAINGAMGYNKGTKTCNNTGGSCHLAGLTPAWGSTGGGCAICHYYPGAVTGKGDAWAAGNGHAAAARHPGLTNAHMTSSTFANVGDTYAAVIADTAKCGLCHRNVKHMNGSGFAHLSSVSTYSTACGTWTFSTGGVGNGTTTTCSNVKCHSGKTTPIWW